MPAYRPAAIKRQACLANMPDYWAVIEDRHGQPPVVVERFNTYREAQVRAEQLTRERAITRLSPHRCV
ncbi:hypothetical protein [Halomonas shantousis]